MEKKEKKIIKKGLKKNYMVNMCNWYYHCMDYNFLNESALIENFKNIISYIKDDEEKINKIEDFKKALKSDLNNQTLKTCYYKFYNLPLLLRL